MNILDHLEVLTGQQERILYMLYWEGQTEEEIARTHNKTHQSVHNAIVRAQDKIKKTFEGGLLFDPQKRVVHMREQDGTDKRGKGLVPNGAQGAKKGPIGLDRSALSLNPATDVYDGVPIARKQFLEDLNAVCASAFLQLMDCGNYNEAARGNRERIAKDRKRELAVRAA